MKFTRIILMLVLLIQLSGCSLICAGMAYFQSTDDFTELGSSGVFYEDDTARKDAELVQAQLPDAIKVIEENQTRPFKHNTSVYVCASRQSFAKYSGVSEMARGAVFNHKLFLSPRAAETDTLNSILIHELSHLHFHQYLGNRRYASNVPPWFQEGLAVYVSNGGGAEKISVEAARDSILTGESFQPNASGSLLFPQTAYWFDLKPQMFYRQSGMFVGYLYQHHQREFHQFIGMLLDDVEFERAFTSSFGQSIESIWHEYLTTLQADLGSSGA